MSFERARPFVGGLILAFLGASFGGGVGVLFHVIELAIAPHLAERPQVQTESPRSAVALSVAAPPTPPAPPKPTVEPLSAAFLPRVEVIHVEGLAPTTGITSWITVMAHLDVYSPEKSWVMTADVPLVLEPGTDCVSQVPAISHMFPGAEVQCQTMPKQ